MRISTKAQPGWQANDILAITIKIDPPDYVTVVLVHNNGERFAIADHELNRDDVIGRSLLDICSSLRILKAGKSNG